MAKPRLRILLVDEEHSRRMNIEKNLAGLGHSRVAPLCSLRELLAIDASLAAMRFSLSCPPDRASINRVMDVVERA